MSKVVAQSASRALSLLISKDKYFRGMPYECLTKCYDATVQSVIEINAPYVALNLFLLLVLYSIALAVISLVLADMRQVLPLTGIWVGYHQNIDNGCVLQKSGAGW